jgi:hypothetical protein
MPGSSLSVWHGVLQLAERVRPLHTTSNSLTGIAAVLWLWVSVALSAFLPFSAALPCAVQAVADYETDITCLQQENVTLKHNIIEHKEVSSTRTPMPYAQPGFVG